MAPFQEEITRNNSSSSITLDRTTTTVTTLGLEERISSLQNNDVNESKNDAFLRYSNDKVRMAKLLLKDVEDYDSQEHEVSSRHSTQEETKTEEEKEAPRRKRQRASSARAEPQATATTTERKTRISFEVHHSLIMEDDLLAMFDEEEDDICCDLDDIQELDEACIGALSAKQLMDLLLQ